MGEVAKEFGISKRTAYRYINLLDSVGFEIEQDFGNRYFIPHDCCHLCGGKKHESPEHKLTNVHSMIASQSGLSLK